VLRRLAARLPVAVVSGRGRDDVAARVGLPGITYVGSHGFDIAGPGLRHEVGDGMPATIDRATGLLRDRLGAIPGLLLEPKRFSLSVHHRLVDDARVPEIEQAAREVAAALPGLRTMLGKRLIELRPDLDWDKGKAVLWLLDRSEGTSIGAHSAGTSPFLDHSAGTSFFPLYLGDDVTDEDAFRAVLDRGLGILVADLEGEPRTTAASYRLRDPGEARTFLERMAQLTG
jgi:trehalose 6-phosphate phosphatase